MARSFSKLRPQLLHPVLNRKDQFIRVISTWTVHPVLLITPSSSRQPPSIPTSSIFFHLARSLRSFAFPSSIHTFHPRNFASDLPGSNWKSRTKQLDEEECLWTASEDESDSENKRTALEKEIRKVRKKSKEHSQRINADDSDELWSVLSESDTEKTLWTGDEGDDDDDIPTEAYPNEKSDAYIDKLFEFEEPPKYRTISELLKAENEPEELSPGKKARKLAVENALKKLKKGPDGRYTNVWEVMSDTDILIGAFENIVSGPEYTELRQGGPKKLNMQFFKDIQTRMRDPNFKFSPEMKLKPKNKLVSRKKWQKAESRRRKARKR